MAGGRPILTVLGAVAFGILGVRVEADPASPPDRPGLGEGRRPFMPKLGPDGEAMRERAMDELQKLSPEKRTELWRAVWAVLNLPPEKRQLVLGFEEERRKKALEEIRRAMEENGIQLDDAGKKAFFQRYFEERRAIEETIRKESDEKRRKLVREMREKLRREFGSKAGSSPGVEASPK